MTRTKAHGKTVYSSSIRQVRPTKFRISLATLFTKHEASFGGAASCLAILTFPKGVCSSNSLLVAFFMGLQRPIRR
jgi:hypothetical protein